MQHLLQQELWEYCNCINTYFFSLNYNTQYSIFVSLNLPPSKNEDKIHSLELYEVALAHGFDLQVQNFLPQSLCDLWLRGEGRPGVLARPEDSHFCLGKKCNFLI